LLLAKQKDVVGLFWVWLQHAVWLGLAWLGFDAAYKHFIYPSACQQIAAAN